MKELDTLWYDAIKKRAGYKSELSRAEGKQIGGEVILGSHHIVGKANQFLRYSLDNGICLENSREHIFGVHSKNPMTSKKYMDAIIKYIGKKRWNYLSDLTKKSIRVDYEEVKKSLLEVLNG